MRQLGGITGSVGNIITGFAGGGGMGALTAALGETITFLKDAVREAAGLEALSMAFDNLRQSSTLSLEALQEAARGTVSQIDLVASANKAMMLGIDPNHLPKLMEMARRAAVAMGISTTQAFQDISTGIGRQSRMILDNLGIVIDSNQAYEDYAGTLGKTVSELTEAERKQAYLNAVLKVGEDQARRLGDQTGSLSESQQRLTAATDDIVASIGSLFLPVVKALVDVLAFAAQGVHFLIDAFGETLISMSPLAMALGILYDNLQIMWAFIEGFFTPVWAALQKVWEGVSEALQSVSEDIGVSAEDTEKAKDEAEKLGEQLGEIVATLVEDLGPALKDIAEDLKWVAKSVRDLKDDLKPLTDRLKDLKGLYDLLHGSLWDLVPASDEVKTKFRELWEWVKELIKPFRTLLDLVIRLIDLLIGESLVPALEQTTEAFIDLEPAVLKTNSAFRSQEGILGSLTSSVFNYKKSLDAIPREIVTVLRTIRVGGGGGGDGDGFPSKGDKGDFPFRPLPFRKGQKGLDITTRGPTLILAGEGPNPVERVQVTPSGTGGGGDTHIHIDLRGAFVPSTSAVEELGQMVIQEMQTVTSRDRRRR